MKTFSPLGYRCPGCRRRARRPQRFCAGCGRWLPDTASGFQPVAAAGDDAACPRCAHPNSRHAEFCMACGLPLSAVVPVARRSPVRRRTARRGLSPRSLLVMMGIQLVVLGGAVYFFRVAHGVANRVFLAGIILAGLVNFSRFLSMYSTTRRLRSRPGPKPNDRPGGW